jgi:4-amino-4-deoxy-L-arabinose transferase-like glycosyltransferase
LRFGGIAHRPRRLRQHLIQKIFRCIVPVHGLILIGSDVSPKLALVLILICTALIRIRLAPTPLERDEGEYAYAGQLMLEGIAPYSLASNMKLPGTYAMHALVMALLGQTIVGIHLGLLLVNATSILLIYFIARRLLFSTAAAAAACAVYAALAISPSVAGTAAHATQYVNVFALAATLLLLDKNIARAGFCFGLAFLMKQHAVFFLLFGGAYLLYQRAGLRALTRFAAAAVLPYALTCLILWRAGVFSNFWFWTVTYAREYALRVDFSSGLDNFLSSFTGIVMTNPALWALAAAGAFLAARARQAGFLLALLFFSFLTTIPGLLFREHYFIPVLPAIALLAGVAASKNWGRWAIAAAIALSLFSDRQFLFTKTPTQAARQLWDDNPFPEAIPAAAWLRAHTAPATPIAVLGSEPEIYFYAHRHSATNYIYMYGLMEPQPYALRMQEELIHDLETRRPAYIVDVDVSTSWLMRENSATRLFDWWDAYRPRHYSLAQSFGDLAIYQRTD